MRRTWSPYWRMYSESWSKTFVGRLRQELLRAVPLACIRRATWEHRRAPILDASVSEVRRACGREACSRHDRVRQRLPIRYDVRSAGLAVLVQLVVHVQPFQDELGRRSRSPPLRARGSVASGSTCRRELLRLLAKPGILTQSAREPPGPAACRRPRYLTPPRSNRRSGGSLADVEVLVEDVLDRLAHDPVDQLVLVPSSSLMVSSSLPRELAEARGQVGDPGHDHRLSRGRSPGARRWKPRSPGWRSTSAPRRPTAGSRAARSGPAADAPRPLP